MNLFNKPNDLTTNGQKPKKSVVKDWTDSLLFAVVAATLIRWIAIEPFTIPTPSMENSLLVGDFLFVSKLHYGARTPKTILQVPLTHQKVWGTNLKSYSDAIQLPQFRLFGFSEVQRGDAVVFNYPLEFEYPVDLKTYWIKRCVGMPGDKLEVRDWQIYINDALVPNPPKAQFRYFIASNEAINDRVFKKYEISEYSPFINDSTKKAQGHYVFTTVETAKELKTLPFVTQVIEDKTPKEKPNERIYPNALMFPWNEDFFGAITIPKEGNKIAINKENLAMYRLVIEKYEGNDNVKIENDKLFIDNQEVKEYTFKQNYYFMMGDNRHNSLDSRFWGFVPADHILGKAVFVWFSLNPIEDKLTDKIRWSRIFRLIE